MHQNIYAAGTLPAKAAILDNAVSALLSDLKSSGMLDETLVVMCGEFGRTVGPLTAAGGRDHWPQQFAFFAGGGIKGGTIVGQTDAQGRDTIDYGWSQKRYVYPEDIEATLYSAVGIDWTTVRHDDPLGRGFEYVPQTGAFSFFPVHELWGIAGRTGLRGPGGRSTHQLPRKLGRVRRRMVQYRGMVRSRTRRRSRRQRSA